MGCVSSKMAVEDLRKEKEEEAHLPNHVVSLTSSTYGLLKLDPEETHLPKPADRSFRSAAARSAGGTSLRRLAASPAESPDTIIDAWELMEDLDDAAAEEKDIPPAAAAAAAEKENRGGAPPEKAAEPDPCRILRPVGNRPASASPKSCPPSKSPPTPTRKKIRSPLFEPELVAFFEKEHCEEAAQIKKVISVSSTPRRRSGGEAAAAVLYTTTLRGIRKTFDDCNEVRAAVEAHGVRIVEKDVSMDGGFREELRRLTGRREVRVPALFVRGRLVGGAEEVMKMEEEGRLAKLLAGIPRAAPGWCDGCGGMRFVLCMDCSGSRKRFDDKEKKSLRCEECNENGLILCPLCG
ncbi:uncharacterized protein LOC144711258 [Wolffia australiana]